MSEKNSFFVIVNPKSGQGKGLKVFQDIKTDLKQHFNIDFAFTKFKKHESLLAQNALKKGFTKFIIIGGDGTLRNFINGVFNQRIVATKDVTFAVIPVGTGNDWIKTHQLPKSAKLAIQTIIKGSVKRQDVGIIEYKTLKKSPEYFMNIAGIGFDGLVVDIIKNKRGLAGFIYLFGAVLGLFRHQPFEAKIKIDNSLHTYNKCFIIQLGIGKYSGSGMRLTDYKDASDGLLDISVANNMSKWVFVSHLRQLFNGKIVQHKSVTSFKCKQLEIITEGNHALLQADGEQLEKDAIKVSLIHKGIAFYC